MEDEVRLGTIAQVTATAAKYAANQAQVKVVSASVSDGSLLIEASKDAFSSDVRTIAFLDAPTGGPSARDDIRYYMMVNEQIRITTVGGAVKAFVRTTLPGLAAV